MTKNIIVHKHNTHEHTWIIPVNVNHRIHDVSVVNKAGIKVKARHHVVGDKMLVHLQQPTSGEIVLAVSEKHFLWKRFQNYLYKLITDFFHRFKK